MNTLEILRGARELLAVPERWTQGVSARDISGNLVCADDEGAVCWCMVGAVSVASSYNYTAANRAHIALGNVVGTTTEYFNDAPERTHAEVLDAFDSAIAAEEAKQ